MTLPPLDLGDGGKLILSNHSTLTVGETGAQSGHQFAGILRSFWPISSEFPRFWRLPKAPAGAPLKYHSGCFRHT